MRISKLSPGPGYDACGKEEIWVKIRVPYQERKITRKSVNIGMRMILPITGIKPKPWICWRSGVYDHVNSFAGKLKTKNKPAVITNSRFIPSQKLFLLNF